MVFRPVVFAVVVAVVSGCIFDANGLRVDPLDAASTDAPWRDLHQADSVASSDGDAEAQNPEAGGDGPTSDGIPTDTVPPCTGCPLGCRPGTSACRAFTPSNVGTQTAAGCGALTFNLAGSIDTTS